MRTRIVAALIASLTFIAPVMAQQSPVVAFESMLNTYFDANNGTIAFGDFDLAFAPEEPLNAQIAVVDSSNTVVASFPFSERYRVRNGVFARAAVRGPADVQLTEPGIYNIVVLIDGKPATRLGVALIQSSAGEDPFNPQKTYRFEGLWRSHAYLTMKDSADFVWPQLNLWVGSIDLPEGKARDSFNAVLLRDGEAVARTKEDLGHLAQGHYDWQRIGFFHPHERKNAHVAKYFTAEDLLVDGAYEIRVTRGSDGAALRSYDFDVEAGEIVPLPETQFGHEPGIDYLLPRTVKRGASSFEFVEAIWIKDGRS